MPIPPQPSLRTKKIIHINCIYVHRVQACRYYGDLVIIMSKVALATVLSILW